MNGRQRALDQAGQERQRPHRQHPATAQPSVQKGRRPGDARRKWAASSQANRQGRDAGFGRVPAPLVSGKHLTCQHAVGVPAPARNIVLEVKYRLSYGLAERARAPKKTRFVQPARIPDEN